MTPQFDKKFEEARIDFEAPSGTRSTPLSSGPPPAISGVFACSPIIPAVEIRENRGEDPIRLALRNKVLAAGIHDTRNLLTVLLHMSTVLEEAIADGRVKDAEVVEMAEGIGVTIQRTLAITQQCMFFDAASNDNKPDMKPVQMDLLSLLTEVQMQVDLPVKIKNRSNSRSILADPNHFARVLVNLLNNVKFHSKNQTGYAEIIIDEIDNYDVIKVRDRGVGLPKDMSKLFNFHAQADASPTGFGVGLASCKLVCEAHNGYILASNNEDGPGATFTIGLPKVEIE